jgi:hypothetical protein
MRQTGHRCHLLAALIVAASTSLAQPAGAPSGSEPAGPVGEPAGPVSDAGSRAPAGPVGADPARDDSAFGAASGNANPRQLDESTVPGWATMSAGERLEFEQRMARYETHAECSAGIAQHRQRLGGQGGRSTPATGSATADPCAHLPRR